MCVCVCERETEREREREGEREREREREFTLHAMPSPPTKQTKTEIVTSNDRLAKELERHPSWIN